MEEKEVFYIILVKRMLNKKNCAKSKANWKFQFRETFYYPSVWWWMAFLSIDITSFVGWIKQVYSFLIGRQIKFTFCSISELA